jgi:hypothetical protein
LALDFCQSSITQRRVRASSFADGLSALVLSASLGYTFVFSSLTGRTLPGSVPRQRCLCRSIFDIALPLMLLTDNVVVTRVSEIAVVIIVGCMPSLPLLYHYIIRNVNRAPNSVSMHTSTFSRAEGSRAPRQRSKTVRYGLAKYLGPVSPVDATTLFSRASEDDQVELRSQVANIEQGAR